MRAAVRPVAIGQVMGVVLMMMCLWSGNGLTQAPVRILGVVTDTLGQSLSDAVVTAVSEKKDSVSTRTNDQGRFALQVPAKMGTGPFTISVRRLGYGLGLVQGIDPSQRTVDNLTFRLVPLPQSLSRVEVQGRRGSPQTWPSITSKEFNTKYVYSASDILRRYRPGLFIKPCPIPGPLKVFVNGIRRDYPRSSDRNVLDDILAEDIEEINYVGCDRNFPIDRQRSLYIVLKPKATEKP